MPSSDPPIPSHDPRENIEREEALALLALNEPIPAGLQAHIDGCAHCQAELAALRRTAHLARDAAERTTPADPAPAVWQRIAAELDLAEPAEHRPGRRRRGRSLGAPRSWRSPALFLAAAVLIAAVGGGIGYLAGRDTGSTGVTAAATARLQHMPGGPADVHGTATVRHTGAGPQLAVSTNGLPLRDGYYEVWLFNPDANKMVAVGTLPQSGTATLPVPPGLDVRAYHVVDISAQNYDGNPAHQQSVLRGALTQ